MARNIVDIEIGSRPGVGFTMSEEGGETTCVGFFPKSWVEADASGVRADSGAGSGCRAEPPDSRGVEAETAGISFFERLLMASGLK